MKQEVEIESRIRELRTVLLETRSEDLRRTIEGAICDCERHLAELEGEVGAASPAGGALWSVGPRREDLRPLLTQDC